MSAVASRIAEWERSSFIKHFSRHELNKAIFKYANQFITDQETILVTLAQNAFGETKDLESIEIVFGPKVVEKIKLLNQLHAMSSFVFCEKNFEKSKDIIIIFLANLKIFFAKKDKYPECEKVITKKKVNYATKLLHLLHINEMKRDLEDVFFSYLNPNVYAGYEKNLASSRPVDLEHERGAKLILKRVLAKFGIRAIIETRVKSICSIHDKVIKKDILHTQILDNIGLRIIVGTKNECYRVMEIVLKYFPTIISKIKDYIVVPKINGYQSLHLTILYEGFPLELQIRTKKMHDYAQFGVADHRIYKKKIYERS